MAVLIGAVPVPGCGSLKLTGLERLRGSQRFVALADGASFAGWEGDTARTWRIWWGSLHVESRRNHTLAPSDMARIAPALRREDWNVYQILAFNGHIQTWLNGVAGVDYREPDPAIPQWSRIALQIHVGGPARVSFRNITLEELPPPADR